MLDVDLGERTMAEQTQSLAAEIETLKETYAAINRNDIPAALKAFDPQMEWIEPHDYPGAGTYRGHAAVMANISKGRKTWAEGSCELERFIVVGDKVVAFVHVRVRLKDRTEWIDGRLADVYTFRNGKAIQMRSFGERQKALDWAGASVSDAI
jgi:ketosteroid isomerase-like protein